jgi:CRP-like cAMP-binding protein
VTRRPQAPDASPFDAPLHAPPRGISEATIAVRPGAWRPDPPECYGRGAFAMVVVEGLILSEVHLHEQPATQLFAREDVLDPWGPAADVTLSGEHVAWRALAPVRLAVLGERFLGASARRPSLALALHRRLAAQGHRASRYAAIAQLRRVDQRIVALFCLLAEDHGRVGADGIRLELRLTHQDIGGLIGACRPTVSQALKSLDAGGVLQVERRRWRLEQEALRLVGIGCAQPGTVDDPAPEVAAAVGAGAV